MLLWLGDSFCMSFCHCHLVSFALGDLNPTAAAAWESESKKAVPHGLTETLQPCREFTLHHANVCVHVYA